VESFDHQKERSALPTGLVGGVCFLCGGFVFCFFLVFLLFWVVSGGEGRFSLKKFY